MRHAILSLFAISALALAACGAPKATYQEDPATVDGKQGQLALLVIDTGTTHVVAAQVRDHHGNIKIAANGQGPTPEVVAADILGGGLIQIAAARAGRSRITTTATAAPVANAEASPVSNVDVDNNVGINVISRRNGRPETIPVAPKYAHLPRIDVNTDDLSPQERGELIALLGSLPRG